MYNFNNLNLQHTNNFDFAYFKKSTRDALNQ